MVDARRSVLLAISCERKRMHVELQRVRAEFADQLEELHARLSKLQLEFLDYQMSVVHDRAQLEQIRRLRSETAFAMAQRDEGTMLN